MRKPPGLRGSWLPGEGNAPWPAATAAPAAPAIPAAPPRGAAAAMAAAFATPSGFAATRPFSDFQATRPLAELQPTRPLAFAAAQPATRRTASATAAAAAAAAAAASITPPSTDGHWQLRGTPGQNLVLMPGQMHLGQQVASLRTLLGSCVAITLWHPIHRIGGMCHFLLPNRTRRTADAPDGRYGDEAVAEMVRTLTALNTGPGEYVAHLYGGADTMSGISAARFNIGERNIEQGWALIEHYGFQLDGVDVGEDIPRTVTLTLATGEVTMRRGSGSAPDHLRG